MPADRTRYSTEEKVAAGLGALGALAIAVSVPAAWDPVATVGSTGGVAEAGLYFELRFKGRPIDPLRWAQAR